MDAELKMALEKIEKYNPIRARLFSYARVIENTSYGMDVNGSMVNAKFTGKLQGVLCVLVDLDIITLDEYGDLFEYFCNCYHEEGENE